MRKFHRLLPYDPEGNLAQVIEYDVGDFDLTVLWNGVPMGGIPPAVKLFVGSGKVPDYMTNPLSWPICSARFVGSLSRRAARDFQTFDAPLFDSNTGQPVPGYKIINVSRHVACLDIANSDLSYEKESPGRIFVVYRISIDSTKVRSNIHLFRLEEWPYAVIFSEELARDCAGRGLLGLAFENCTTTR